MKPKQFFYTKFLLIFSFFIFNSSMLVAQAPDNCIENDLEVGVNLVIGGTQGKFIFTPAFVSGQDFLAIAPNNTNATSYNWEFDKELRFDASGELIKKITSGTQRAFSVELSGTRNFQIMGDGTIYGRELFVKLGAFPDYVFTEHYPLLTLKEVEKHIEKNGHLPNIPSAKEIEANGIGVGVLQVLQMEKIEELTLYLIEMNKRLEVLETENMKLKTTIEILKNK